ncbi:MAG: YitT family protein [Gaiellaceae bacterium]
MRGGLVARSVSLVGGLFLFAAGIVALLESELGLSPWDVLNQGLQRQTPLSFGIANIVVGLVVLFVAWALGSRPGIGTVANAVLIGVFVDLLLLVPAVAELAGSALAVRIVLLPVGLALFGIGTAFYIGAGLGAGPRDSLMLVLSRRTGARIGLVRGLLEVSVLLAGIALGGTFGVGTIAFALLIGPIIEVSFALLERSPLAVPGRPTSVIESQ